MSPAQAAQDAEGSNRPAWQALVGPDLTALVEAQGSPPLEVQPNGRLVSTTSARAAFRVRLADGRLLKARRVESAQRAATLAAIWPLIASLRFSPGLACAGNALLEAWLPGAPLDATTMTRARLEEAGDLLGRLHRLVLPTAADFAPKVPQTPARLLRRVERHLLTLVDLGLLSRAQGRGLLDKATRSLPPRLDAGLIHHDFCAENLIVSPDGNLWAIDNEDMRFGPLDADLARCFLRWPMSPADQDAFWTGYCRYRSGEPYAAHWPFWSIWALAGAAEFRAARGLPVDVWIEQLQAWQHRYPRRDLLRDQQCPNLVFLVQPIRR